MQFHSKKMSQFRNRFGWLLRQHFQKSTPNVSINNRISTISVSSTLDRHNNNLIRNRPKFPIQRHNYRPISTSFNQNLNETTNEQQQQQNNTHKNKPMTNPIFGYDVKIDGHKIHYESAGQGEHVLLLMPGALGTGRNDFLPQLTGLDGSKFKIIAWDPPGYGQSRPPERDFEDFYRRDAIMAAKLMKKLNHESYSILGWSDGGITGIILAAANPYNVQKLIIWGANAYVCEEDRELLRKVRDARNGWSERMRRPMIEIYGDEHFYQLWDRFISHMLTLSDICKMDLKRIECPVLILHGDQDPMLAREHPLYLVNNIPNATLFRFAKGKHNIHQRYAEEFNELCEDFLLVK
ncbi:serine hydrolase BPHL [Dermatophagoides farinae]